MTPADELFEYLATGPTPDCDDIFAAAMPDADGPTFERIVTRLLARGHDASLGALISQFDRLPSDAQSRVRSDPRKLRAGLARALSSPSPAARQHALRLMLDEPSPNLAHYLPDLLRSSDTDVSKLAAQALRRMAERALEPIAATDAQRRADHALILRALRDAVRTFEAHYRLEAIEACLWHAASLGEGLWTALDDRKSALGTAVAQHLADWRHPRLAAFLLLALARQNWRRPALEMLANWSTPEERLALIRCLPLMKNEEVRRAAHAMHKPGWYIDLNDDFLDPLAADDRAAAVYWALFVGVSDEDRRRLLVRWHRSRHPEAGSAAIWALAEMGDARAVALLNEQAHAPQDTPDAILWLRAARSDPGRALRGRSHRGPGAAPMPSSAEPQRPAPGAAAAPPLRTASSDAEEFHLLWQVCRRRAMREDAELLEVVRANIGVWRDALLAQLRSADPRDRILVLRVLGTSELAAAFRAELRSLLGDPVEGIRRLAETLLNASNADDALPIGAAAPVLPAEADATRIRSELRRLLEQLVAAEHDTGQFENLLAQVRGLVALTSGPTPPAASASSPETTT